MSAVLDATFATSGTAVPPVRCANPVECDNRAHDAYGRAKKYLAQAGADLTLTLCSETAAHTWHTAPLGWAERLQRLWRPNAPAAVLRALLS